MSTATAPGTYTPNLDTETALYTYVDERTHSGDLALFAVYRNNSTSDHARVAVGTATRSNVGMRVGNGVAIHDGTHDTVTVTATFTVQEGRRTRRYTAGEPFATEPANRCGATGQHRNFDFARNRNSLAAPDAAVTCAKCLKRAAKTAATTRTRSTR